jgi:IS30 family transposase
MTSNQRKRRNTRSSRKIDEEKVTQLHQQGVPMRDIAKHQGVYPSTISRFLARTKPELEAIEDFKTHRGDVLANLQRKSVNVQERILDSIDDGVIGALNAHQKSGMMMALNTVTGTMYDKERLERGQSTQNVSVYTKLLNDTVKDLFKRERTQTVVSGPAIETSASSNVQATTLDRQS